MGNSLSSMRSSLSLALCLLPYLFLVNLQYFDLCRRDGVRCTDR